MSRPRILVAEAAGFPASAAGVLRESGDLLLADLDRDGLLRMVASADVLWVRLRHQVDREVMAAAHGLRILATPTTGLTHIDTDEASRRGIQVLSLRGETEFLRDIRATAEHALGLMLALVRRLPAAAQHTVGGGWSRDRFKGRELYGMTVGIVGYGRLGRIVARYLHAFDVRVVASDPHVDAATVPSGVTLMPLDALLRAADVVTLHASYTASNRGMFGAAQFDAMKPGAYFVNTARGELVDEAALEAALRSGRLAGAALDVLADERSTGMRDNRLVRYARERDDVIITPHIGGCTQESMEKTELHLARRLVALLGRHSAESGPAPMPAALAAGG
jgi:D-3-phosphoglycerate dehydrogenase